MTSTLFLVKNDLKHLNMSAQVDSSGHSSVNSAFSAVALEVAELLQHAFLNQKSSVLLRK